MPLLVYKKNWQLASGCKQQQGSPDQLLIG
jgi:hypothetical protein